MRSIHHPLKRPLLGLSLSLLVGIVLAAPIAQAQIEEEDLAPDDAGLSGLQLLRHQLEQATALFQSADQPDSIPMLSEAIEGLQAMAARSAEADDLLIQALDLRAQATFNLGDRQITEGDLRQLLHLRPNIELDPSLVSPRLIDIFEKIRKQTVGELRVQVSPPEAKVRIGDQRLSADSGALRLLPGFYELIFERPGYAPHTEVAEVTPGGTLRFDITLERQTAVLGVITRPAGVQVHIDGRLAGVTAGAAPDDWPIEGDAARFPLSEFSSELLIEGLAPGEYEVEMSLQHHRGRRLRVLVPELSDYRIGAFALEAAEGVVILETLPKQAQILVDGQPAIVQRSGESSRLLLVPGEHRLTISAGTAGVFEQRVSIADRESKRLAVRLRPGISFFGVLGADERAAKALAERLAAQLGGLSGWALLVRQSEGAALLAEQRFTVGALRALSRGQTADVVGVDWAALQRGGDRAAPGAVYLLAVLSDDLVATHADLWVWPAAPGPAAPDRWRVALGDADFLAPLMRAFERPLRLFRPSLGGVLIDSLAASGPVVVDATPGGPLASAGVSVGEEVLSLDGTALTSTGDLLARLEGMQTGQSVKLNVRGRSGAREVGVVLGQSPAMVETHQPGLVYAAVAAALAQARSQAPTPPAWLLALNEAVLQIHARQWDEAVRSLRSVDAPPRNGLSKGAVEYLTGLALAAAGPAYRSAALEALERAASDPEARLLSDDGPWIAPRARARLAAQGLASP